ncbi:ATP-dependent endonuclease [Pantoea stewartii subsp. indologenes]|uniref:ATP-dependent endonuclease n=1 Tax=Pantoea stewartii TaxID=66269 RepID=UPI003FA47669
MEGDAEEVLIPSFAEAMGINLDELGITVCSVAGVNFEPYVKLAGSLGIRMAVITDWNPLDGSKPPLGKARAISIWDAFCAVRSDKYKLSAADRAWFVDKGFEECRDVRKQAGIFLSSQTFEVSVANALGLKDVLLNIFDEQGYGSLRSSRIASCRAGQIPDPEQLLAMISDIGKGRLAGKLKKKAPGLAPPDYIAAAIQYAVSNV